MRLYRAFWSVPPDLYLHVPDTTMLQTARDAMTLLTDRAEQFEGNRQAYWRVNRMPAALQWYLFPHVVNEYCTFLGEIQAGGVCLAHVVDASGPREGA